MYAKFTGRPLAFVRADHRGKPWAFLFSHPPFFGVAHVPGAPFTSSSMTSSSTFLPSLCPGVGCFPTPPSNRACPPVFPCRTLRVIPREAVSAPPMSQTDGFFFFGIFQFKYLSAQFFRLFGFFSVFAGSLGFSFFPWGDCEGGRCSDGHLLGLPWRFASLHLAWIQHLLTVLSITRPRPFLFPDPFSTLTLWKEGQGGQLWVKVLAAEWTCKCASFFLLVRKVCPAGMASMAGLCWSLKRVL